MIRPAQSPGSNPGFYVGFSRLTGQAALLAAQGHLLPGLAVLTIGHVIMLSGDILVKPKLIGAAGHAPFLLVLLAIFGGLRCSAWSA